MFGKAFSYTGGSGNNDLKLRQPAVAGRFYPAGKIVLKDMLEAFFQAAIPHRCDNLLGVISPHAGYVYSGQVAANAINQIDPEKSFDRIFLIGSSHYTQFDGASVYNIGHYQTPLGIVDVDLDFASSLIKNYKFFVFNPDAHKQEHSLEVQLPFLQFHLKKPFRIVPIIIGTQSVKTILAISETLAPFFDERNLFVISSDFSHYPNYDIAKQIDGITAESISQNSPDHFMETLKENGRKNISELATSMCGWSSMLTTLNITKHLPDIAIKRVFYQNSGDADFGDRSRVVGYWAITISKNKLEKPTFNLPDDEKEALLLIARKTLNEFVKFSKNYKLEKDEINAFTKFDNGAFVSVYCNEKLRGCIGRFNPGKPLYQTIQKMVISAAANDSRFEPIGIEELDDSNIEISVLTPMKKINSIHEIVLGKHGIYLKKGCQSGTFLPQVANNKDWTVEDFLGYCARDKANIGWEGWRNAEIFIYEAIIFSESSNP